MLREKINNVEESTFRVLSNFEIDFTDPEEIVSVDLARLESGFLLSLRVITTIKRELRRLLQLSR